MGVREHKAAMAMAIGTPLWCFLLAVLSNGHSVMLFLFLAAGIASIAARGLRRKKLRISTIFRKMRKEPEYFVYRTDFYVNVMLVFVSYLVFESYQEIFGIRFSLAANILGGLMFFVAIILFNSSASNQLTAKEEARLGPFFVKRK